MKDPKQRNRSRDLKPRRPLRQPPVSLQPLDFESAIDGLLGVPAKKPSKKAKKNQPTNGKKGKAKGV
jgi:hypothetical protein